MSEPTPLSNVAADIADLVERYRDDALAADERDQLARRLAAERVFRDEFRAHLRMAQTLTAGLECDPAASHRRAELAVAALSSSRRLAVWNAVTSEIDADRRLVLPSGWWRWVGAGAAAALLLTAIVPWLLRSDVRHPPVPGGSPTVTAIANPPAVPTSVPEPSPRRSTSPGVIPDAVVRVAPEPVPAEPTDLASIAGAPPAPLPVPSTAVTAEVVADPLTVPVVRTTVPHPASTVIASAHVTQDEERPALPARGAWIAGRASVRRGARELPAHGLLALVPGDEIEIADQGASLQPDDGIHLACAPHARLVVSPSTGRRQVGRYVALISGAIEEIEVASGETLIVATDHGDVVATGAKLELSLHDGWLRCAVSEGNIRVGPQHRRIDAGSAVVLAGGRVLTVYGPGRTGAAVLGGAWTRRGAPWFPFMAQTTVRTPAAFAALAADGFEAVILTSANDARIAAQAGLGVILELAPNLRADIPALCAQPGLLGWSVAHDGSPRSLQEALRTVATVRRSDVARVVMTKAGPGDAGRRLVAAVESLMTSDPAQQANHAPVVRLTVSADAEALRLRTYSALTEGACGVLVVDPQAQPAVVRALLTELAHVTPLLAAGEREVLAAPEGVAAARWSAGHDQVLIAVNHGDRAAVMTATGTWTNGLHPLSDEGETLVAGRLQVPAHGVCVLVTSFH